MDDSIFFAIVLAIACTAFVFLIRYYMRMDDKKEALKLEYENALKSNDRAKALEIGRKYYSHLRGGELSIYDEQAITNDLSTMK